MDRQRSAEFLPYPILPFDVRAVTAIREKAAEARLCLGCERLSNVRRENGRPAVIQCAMDAAISIMSADRANMQTVHAGQQLVMSGQRGFSQPFLDFFDIVTGQHTACGTALEEGRSIVIPDVTTSAVYSRDVLEVLLNDGIRAVCSTPLLTDGDRTWGVLSVHYCRPYCPRDTDVGRLEKLAGFVGNLLHTRWGGIG